MKLARWFVIAVFLVLSLFAFTVAAQTTEFSYQGSLITSGTPATGSFDFEFALYDALTGGTQIGSTLTRIGTAVAGGIFSVNLDFGVAAFTGANRYLEVHVRSTGTPTFTSLSPRSQLNSTPYAIRALTVTGPVTGSNSVATLSVTNAQPGIVDINPTNLPPAALRAEATSTSNSNIGLFGIAQGTYGIGVIGWTLGNGSGDNDKPIGVLGISTSPTGSTRGVQAQVYSPDGIAVHAQSNTGMLFVAESGPEGAQTDKMTVDANGNLNLAGTAHVQNLVVSGTKNAVSTLPDGSRVLLYATESPENWFEDFGTAKLKNGRAVIKIDKIFALTTNVTVPYKVFLTPNGKCRGLYVIRKSAGSFEVREIGDGRSNVEVDFRIVARRRGYENVRFAPDPLPPARKR